MSQLNAKKTVRTHEGAPAYQVNAELMLRRSIMACMLWEKTFYEEGKNIADRIEELVPQVDPLRVASMAFEARTAGKLRHVPLLIASIMAGLKTHKPYVAELLGHIIQRPDELTEFLAIYWRKKKCPLSAQVKKGLATAFVKFNEYSLAKYNRDNAIKLRDVLFLCHAKPKDAEQEALWKRLIDGKLETPDTWEVALSAGEDKKEAWERLMFEGKLGALALLRNLRNMKEANVNEARIRDALASAKVERVLPFRFVAAARYAPRLEPELEAAMFRCLGDTDKLPGKTRLLIDVSGSMKDKISAKSEMLRIDAACGLAILAREICERCDVFTFSHNVVEVPPRRGFALRDSIVKSQPMVGTYLGKALQSLDSDYDRIIVFTDEQSHDRVPAPRGKGYMVNVATNQFGVGYGSWNHIDGFSEAIIDYIMAYENAN